MKEVLVNSDNQWNGFSIKDDSDQKKKNADIGHFYYLKEVTRSTSVNTEKHVSFDFPYDTFSKLITVI